MSYILCTLNRRVMFKSKLSDREAGAGTSVLVSEDAEPDDNGCVQVWLARQSPAEAQASRSEFVAVVPLTVIREF